MNENDGRSGRWTHKIHRVALSLRRGEMLPVETNLLGDLRIEMCADPHTVSVLPWTHHLAGVKRVRHRDN